MDPRVSLLMAAFQFEASDLALNREGRLSTRQRTVLRAGRMGMWLSLGVFALVTAGSVGFLTMMNPGASTPERAAAPGSLSPGLIAAIVGAIVVLIGVLIARPFIAAARGTRVQHAQGRPSRAPDKGPGYGLRLGPTLLRLGSLEQAAAFDPESEYRVYFVDGPVHFVLSAEVVGAAFPADDARGQASGELEARQLRVFRRGYVIVVVLGLLAMAVPIAGMAVSRLEGNPRRLAWMALVALTAGFAMFAVRWLSPRND